MQSAHAARTRTPFALHRIRSAGGAVTGIELKAVDGDPIAIKRRLLAHEGYRFGR